MTTASPSVLSAPSPARIWWWNRWARAGVAPQATAVLGSVEGLRGLAALTVTWFHLAWATNFPDGAIKASGTYGYLGVDAFFVISGFILPYVLHQRGYQVRNYGRFLLKRFIRLEPPYLLAVVVALIPLYVTSQIAIGGRPGRPFDVTLTQVLLHVGYLNQVVFIPAVNPVFWSLAIEMQWYLVLGVLVPLLVSPRRATRLALLLGASALAYVIPTHVLLFHYAPLFLIGIVAFQRRARITGPAEYAVGLAIVALGGWVTVGPLAILVGLLSAATIANVEFRHPAVLWLGTVSYSLYLVHWPIGGHVVNGAVKAGVPWPGLIAVLVLAIGLSLLGAQVMYRYVEKPSRTFAARVSY